MLLPVAPGGVFVVAGAGFEASLEDANEPVGEPSQGVIVTVASGALLVVGGTGSGEVLRAAYVRPLRASVSRLLLA